MYFVRGVRLTNSAMSALSFFAGITLVPPLTFNTSAATIQSSGSGSRRRWSGF
jgi:hypothetical protein